jgi:shikimate dehydrogenase
MADTEQPRLFAVFGDPIAHSLSPALHHAGFRYRGWTDCYYVPVRVTPGTLQKTLEAFRVLGGVGANVTRPLKEEAFQAGWLVARDEWASRAAAVNTLAWREDGWHGYNTDAPALRAALWDRGVKDPKVLVLGGGGVARASAAAFDEAAVTVAARRPVSWARWMGWDDGLACAGDFDVVINATPLGQVREDTWPVPPAVRPGQWIVDWVYAPRDTALLRYARDKGAGTVDGLELLARQAALAWGPWFGEGVPWTVLLEGVAT